MISEVSKHENFSTIDLRCAYHQVPIKDSEKHYTAFEADGVPEMSEMDDLHNINWISVPNTPYIMKYLFHDTGYHVMVSNLTNLYSEKLNVTSILKRVKELNPFVEMKLTVILGHLKKALEKCFNQEAQPCMNHFSHKLSLSLEFPAGLVSCKYIFELDLLDAEQISEHITIPIIYNALLSQRKILELQKKILANESNKSTLTSNISISTQDPIDPDWLKGKNVSTENLLDSFLKLQSFFKDLHAENLVAYNASRKEKSKDDHSVPSASKRFKFPENCDGVSSSIKFEDSDKKPSIKEEEETISSDNPSSQTKSIVKKKKQFKI